MNSELRGQKSPTAIQTCYVFPTFSGQNNGMDKVESLTLQIFAHLSSLADHVERVDIEAVALLSVQDKKEDEMSCIKYEILSNYCKPFRRETNFAETENDKNILQIKNLIKEILPTLKNIFFGCESFNYPQNLKKPDEALRILKADQLVWQNELHQYYKAPFVTILNQAFKQASSLITHRKTNAKVLRCQQAVFYTFLGLALGGKLTNYKSLVFLGLFTSSITLIFMFVHYGKSLLKITRLADELKSSVGKGEHEAYINRL